MGIVTYLYSLSGRFLSSHIFSGFDLGTEKTSGQTSVFLAKFSSLTMMKSCSYTAKKNHLKTFK